MFNGIKIRCNSYPAKIEQWLIFFFTIGLSLDVFTLLVLVVLLDIATINVDGMCKKISNTIDKNTLECTFQATFRYGSLYRKQSVIDGGVECSLSIITQENPSKISFAIWGLLPSTYQDEWSYFQSVYDTLNCTVEELNSTPFFDTCLDNQRCLVLVSGFFIYHLKNGVLYPYYVYHDEGLPISLGGVYTQLDDGFLTVALIMKESDAVIREIQNIENTMPLIIEQKDRSNWLNNTTSTEQIQNQLVSKQDHHLKAHPVAREFFKNNITYDTILEPMDYKNIPKV